ncbi:diacylglycerol kinase [Gracilaria domingensis]|nr:diacylglycerol kinase [Gracilaria domingensis]
MIAFVNPGSGGNMGGVVLDLLKNQIGDENVFDIKADKGPERGLRMRAVDSPQHLICIVAGGDGTFSWVANAVEKQNLSHVHLLVIPLGSGNDMARALGWGKKYPGERFIKDAIKRINETPVEQMVLRRLDVWRLATQSKDTHVDNDGIEHGARPLVCNYLSLGADAYVELRFNQMRWQNPDKHNSRLGNFKAHAMVGLKYMCQPKSRKIYVSDHIETLLVDDQPISIPAYLQAIIFLNIPSYGAGSQPWGTVKSHDAKDDLDHSRSVTDMFVDDQLFEVIGLKSLKHFGTIRMFGRHGVRIAQGSRMSLTLKSESTPFQVDGEPWEQHGGTVTLEPGNKVGVLRGPIWTSSPKKRAKFNTKTNDVAEDLDDDDEQDSVVELDSDTEQPAPVADTNDQITPA